MLKDNESKVLERSDIIIEGNTALWDLRLDGDINGTYTGTFRFKCYLNPLQQIAADRERRELLGNQPLYAGDHESLLAYALTQLKYRIITAPPFWASSNSSFAGDIADENIISAVLDAALGAEVKYKTLLKKKKLESIETAKNAINKAMEVEDEDPEGEE